MGWGLFVFGVVVGVVVAVDAVTVAASARAVEKEVEVEPRREEMSNALKFTQNSSYSSMEMVMPSYRYISLAITYVLSRQSRGAISLVIA